jgi:hypothetical protein
VKAQAMEVVISTAVRKLTRTDFQNLTKEWFKNKMDIVFDQNAHYQ